MLQGSFVNMGSFSTVWVLLIGFARTESTVILYEEINFNGLIAEYYPSGDFCIDLTEIAGGFCLSSSITTDQCIMIYSGKACKSYSYKLNPGNYSNLADIKHDGYGPVESFIFANNIWSFGACETTQGDMPVSFMFDDGIKEVSQLEIKNLCHRVNISASAMLDVNVIHNHGNCIIVYPHHIPVPITLKGGESPLSRSIFNHSLFPNYQVAGMGVSPCKISSFCISLNTTVTKFSIRNTEMSAEPKSADLSMAATSTFINDGWAIISQDYTASSTIIEATETTMASSYSSMNSFSVKAGVEVEFGGGIPLIASTKVTASLSLAYTHESTSTQDQSNTIRHEISTTFSVNQKIEIEPCTKYKVNSYLKMVKGYPMIYNVTFEVTGTTGGKVLTAQEIREHLGQLHYIKDKDEHTVVASELGSILADFGLKSIVDGSGEVIPKCLNDSRKVDPRLYFLKMKPTFLTNKKM